MIFGGHLKFDGSSDMYENRQDHFDNLRTGAIEPNMPPLGFQVPGDDMAGGVQLRLSSERTVD